MKSWIIHCVLILLTISFTTESSMPSVVVKLHDSATLPCSYTCPGLVTWTPFGKPKDILAQCDVTSCHSKEGYQMFHSQYLKGNLSLIISDADFSKRGVYTSDCDQTTACDVNLQIQPLNSTVRLKSGQSLVLDLDVPAAVQVVYNSAQVCSVSACSPDCQQEYQQRISAALELRKVRPADSGVYIIQDAKNGVIHTYTVTVTDAGPDAAGHGVVQCLLIVLVCVFGLWALISTVLYCKEKCKCRRRGNGFDPNNKAPQHREEEEEEEEEDDRERLLSPDKPQMLKSTPEHQPNTQ